MRLIDADELLEHAYRDKLDSRELIADMINNAPTIKEIPLNLPLSLVIKALEQESKTDVLDKIRAEIEQTYEQEKEIDTKWAAGLKYSLKIIDNALKEVEQ